MYLPTDMVVHTWVQAGCKCEHKEKRLLTHIHAQAVRCRHSIMARCRKAGSAGVGRVRWAQQGAGNSGLGTGGHGQADVSGLQK